MTAFWKKPKQAARYGQAYIVQKYYCGWQYWCLFLLQSSDLSKTDYQLKINIIIEEYYLVDC